MPVWSKGPAIDSEISISTTKNPQPFLYLYFNLYTELELPFDNHMKTLGIASWYALNCP